MVEEIKIVKGKERKKVVADRDVKIIGDPADLAKHINDYPKWNTFRVIAKGFVIQQYINGKLMCELKDEHKETRRASGVLALQLHQGPPMKVQFRNIQLSGK